jgi:hypothetical protein
VEHCGRPIATNSPTWNFLQFSLTDFKAASLKGLLMRIPIVCYVAFLVFCPTFSTTHPCTDQNQQPEIDRIYVEDQRVINLPDLHAPESLSRTDVAREMATRKLIAEEKLRTGREFREAAIIFQHSHQPDDYLLAHTLALIAVAKGDKSGVR